ncbi:MAG: ABC transporter ATP-binding protein [Tepidibacter sp.]|jgi:energy-coupling factor transport system ATP-binding protein|uniref:ABC transporter ATP-binding protein n=1 Tax=Tepidibacter sp. TaxID=2529387 RepID=UPI0025DC49E0|nr:ABC transporter ATP-binding protein [Tepidibacter sp.]MCT4509132.1 ABC transporter ATP-binding protein [Tepidibacter sp.]
MAPIISFKDFTFKYKSLSKPTLNNINLDIQKGEKVLIAGPSGSGKSTLAHCINGLIPFSYDGDITGELAIDNINPYKTSIFEISKRVGTILQDQDGQFIGLSVGEDIAFYFENENIEQSKMKEEVIKAAELVDMMEYIDYSPYELSGGQKQRVSLAGILTTQAEVLLFDEPLANLDPASGKKVMRLIDEIHKKTGKTIIIVEHRIEDVLEVPFDKVIVVDNGQIKACTTPSEILSTNVLKESGLREPLYIEALKHSDCIIKKEDKLDDFDNVDKGEFKDSVNSWYKNLKTFKNKKEHEKLVLSLKDVEFSYDKNEKIIKGISFDLYEGEIISLLGNNGAGKSTLSNIVTGINKHNKGDILYMNENINDWSISNRGIHIGYVMQNPNYMITQNIIKDEVALGILDKGYDNETISTKVEEVLRICGLISYKNWPVSALSYGQKKRLSIASILILEPKILILDEPTAGQDHKHYTEFMEFIKSLAAKGISIILITHDMHLALEYTNRAIVMCDGKKIADDRVSNVLADEKVIKQANLKETSLSKLANLLGIEDVNLFIQSFIDYENDKKECING